MHLGKGDKKFEQGPPPHPLIWTKSKRTAVFPQDTFPKYDKSAVETIKIKCSVEKLTEADASLGIV